MQQPPNNWGQPPQGGFQGQQPQPQQGGFGQPAGQAQGAFGQPPGQAPGGWGQPPGQQGGYPAPGQAGYPQQPGPNPYQAPGAYGGAGAMAATKPDLKQILFSFEGRASRAHYWLYGVGLALAVGIVGGILTALLDSVGAIISLLLYLPLIWIGLAVSVKRWHDRGKSGWWIFIGFVPLIGGLWQLIECGFLEGDAGPNQYGPPVA